MQPQLRRAAASSAGGILPIARADFGAKDKRRKENHKIVFDIETQSQSDKALIGSKL
jgi:hypothetical protein